MNTSLAKQQTIRELVSAYASTCTTIRESFAAIVEAQTRLNLAYSLTENHSIHIDASRHSNADNFDEPERCIERVRRQVWGHIVDRLSLRSMMSTTRWNELDKQLRDGHELAEITEANVYAFIQQYSGSLPEMLTEAVNEVFEWLRPHHSQHKTNSELEVPSKIVLTGVVELKWLSKPGFRVRHHQEQRFIALENCFHALDGKGSIAQNHYSDLENAINQSTTDRAETAYFRVRMFKNHNLHLEVRRRDLLARFNAIAGGKRLAPERNAA